MGCQKLSYYQSDFLIVFAFKENRGRYLVKTILATLLTATEVCQMNIRPIINNTSCFIVVLILSFICLTNTVSAETKTFIKEYTYQAGDEDSRNSSRIISLREVKRLLLEELGTYLESQTEVKNFQITKDLTTI